MHMSMRTARDNESIVAFDLGHAWLLGSGRVLVGVGLDALREQSAGVLGP